MAGSKKNILVACRDKKLSDIISNEVKNAAVVTHCTDVNSFVKNLPKANIVFFSDDLSGSDGGLGALFAYKKEKPLDSSVELVLLTKSNSKAFKIFLSSGQIGNTLDPNLPADEVLHHAMDIVFKSNRQHKRYMVSMAVTLGAFGKSFRLETKDISLNGSLIKCNRKLASRLQIEDKILLQFHKLSGEKVCEVEGVVKKIFYRKFLFFRNYYTAIQFQNVDKEFEKNISELINDYVEHEYTLATSTSLSYM